MCRNIRNLHGTEKMVFWMSIAEAYLNDAYLVYDYFGYAYDEGFNLSTNIIRPFIREFYEAIARVTNHVIPSGSMDQSYAENNLPYLLRAFAEAEVDEDWTYRIYLPFSGPADATAMPHWHCVPSRRFEHVEMESEFDDDDYAGITSRQDRIMNSRIAFRMA